MGESSYFILLSLQFFRIFVFQLFLLVLHKSSPLTSFNKINANNNFNKLIVKHTQILGRLYFESQRGVVPRKLRTIGFSPVVEPSLQAAVTVRCTGLRSIKLATQDFFTITSLGAQKVIFGYPNPYLRTGIVGVRLTTYSVSRSQLSNVGMSSAV